MVVPRRDSAEDGLRALNFIDNWPHPFYPISVDFGKWRAGRNEQRILVLIRSEDFAVLRPAIPARAKGGGMLDSVTHYEDDSAGASLGNMQRADCRGLQPRTGQMSHPCGFQDCRNPAFFAGLTGGAMKPMPWKTPVAGFESIGTGTFAAMENCCNNSL